MDAKDKKDFQKVFQNTLMAFWDKALEPTLNKLYEKVDGLEGRLGRVEQKVIAVDQRIQSMDKQLEIIRKTLNEKANNILVTRIEGSILTRIDKLEKNISPKISKHEEKLEDHEKRITRIEKTAPLTP